MQPNSKTGRVKYFAVCEFCICFILFVGYSRLHALLRMHCLPIYHLFAGSFCSPFVTTCTYPPRFIFNRIENQLSTKRKRLLWLVLQVNNNNNALPAVVSRSDPNRVPLLSLLSYPEHNTVGLEFG